MSLPLAGRCHYHPMRAGIGVCVVCRQVICGECSTPVDGINRCAACLSKLAAKAQTRAARSPFGAASLFTAAVVFAALFGGLCALAPLLGR